MSHTTSLAPCGLSKLCSKASKKTDAETRAIGLFVKHLSNTMALNSEIRCYPDNNSCLTRTDFMMEIGSDLWFVEHTMLGFDGQVEERIKSAEDFLDAPLRALAVERNIRLVVSLKFREHSITDSELANYQLAIERHLRKLDNQKINTTQTYSLLNNLIDVQIRTSEYQDEINRFGHLLLIFSMSLSTELNKQFEIANRDPIVKKFDEQIRKIGKIQRTALLIDQTYKIKEDGSIFHGNGIYPEDFLREKIEEIASRKTHQIDQVWLINFQDQVLLLNDWS